ncbi:PAS domain-containing sensor histidine kinase [Candidatus Chloroploca sp. Khr17]|uniref:PAS domain-containing sensor histidine kinase n=1 Tax=Candidatus Chloroploca sp. Khr17 TaxID=2496869 RepID=UPI00101CD5D1|nr:PAS domain-containing sensor histidine kinase [Candidatus Chloroploca sp. Khr17]
MIEKTALSRANGHSQQHIPPTSIAMHAAGTTNGVVQGAELPADHQLLAIIPGLIFTCHPNGTWNYVNPAFCTYTGTPAEALTDLGWVELVHPDERPITLQQWQTAIRHSASFQIEYRLCGADDIYHWFRTQCTPQLDATGTLIGWTGIAVSVDSEHQLENEQMLRQKAEQAAAERDCMLAFIAHELRSPLTVLLGQSTLLQRRLNNHEGIEPNTHRMAEILVAQTIHLKDLMSTLLDATQLDYGELQLCKTTLDLGALVERVAQSFAPTLSAHTLRLDPDPSPLWIKGDALRLEQVLLNLIENAVKYSPGGSEIVIRTMLHDGQVQIDVCDSGIGIPAQVQPYLFQRFFRAKAEDRRVAAGLGLGLYLCKAIMDLHEGSIRVQSVEGEGCTVTLLLSRIPVQHAWQD